MMMFMFPLADRDLDLLFTNKYFSSRRFVEAAKKGDLIELEIQISLPEANINAVYEGNTALHAAVTIAGIKRLQTVKWLLDRGIDSGACNSIGHTGLSLANELNYTDVILELNHYGGYPEREQHNQLKLK